MVDDMEPITRICAACGETFTVSPDEQLFLQRLAAQRGGDREWQLPRRCVHCRADRRHARQAITHAADQDIPCRCANCGDSFLFRVVDQVFYMKNNFAQPRRCPPCRNARKGLSR